MAHVGRAPPLPVRAGPAGPRRLRRLSTLDQRPQFLSASPAGRFKGKDPTVAAERLASESCDDAAVVYIGKADLLRRRLRQYARFGAGEPVGHWGGRFIWQLADSDQLQVAWRVLTGTETARAFEQRLLERFVELHGVRPFANLTG